MAKAPAPGEQTLLPATTPAPAPKAPLGGYQVPRGQGQCSACKQAIPPAEKYMAGIRDAEGQFLRDDVCIPCWNKADRKPYFAWWRSAVPVPGRRRRTFVDDSILCDVFERLEQETLAPRLAFRFVLGLILLRKRVLICEEVQKSDGREVWAVRLRGRDARFSLVNPQLTDEQVEEVSNQMTQILAMEGGEP